MNKYHLTIIRNGNYETLFAEITSIESFIAIEKELGRDVHILYSRELSAYEWSMFGLLKLR